MQRLGQVLDNLKLLRDQQPLLGGVQRLPGQVLHRDVGLPGDLAYLENPADVLVGDAGLGAGFLGKPLRGLGVEGANELEGDRALQPAVPRPVHDAHAALTKKAQDLVAIPLLEPVRDVQVH
jgi:hypothetical protein